MFRRRSAASGDREKCRLQAAHCHGWLPRGGGSQNGLQSPPELSQGLGIGIGAGRRAAPIRRLLSSECTLHGEGILPLLLQDVCRPATFHASESPGSRSFGFGLSPCRPPIRIKAIEPKLEPLARVAPQRIFRISRPCPRGTGCRAAQESASHPGLTIWSQSRRKEALAGAGPLRLRVVSTARPGSRSGVCITRKSSRL